jgi:hypothetical protein
MEFVISAHSINIVKYILNIPLPLSLVAILPFIKYKSHDNNSHDFFFHTQYATS